METVQQFSTVCKVEFSVGPMSALTARSKKKTILTGRWGWSDRISITITVPSAGSDGYKWYNITPWSKIGGRQEKKEAFFP